MTSHSEALKSFVSDCRAAGEATAMQDFESVCYGILRSMNNGQSMMILRVANLKDLSLLSRPYYRQEMQESLSKIGHFKVTMSMGLPLSDTITISWD